jgi:hypothetical protein
MFSNPKNFINLMKTIATLQMVFLSTNANRIAPYCRPFRPDEEKERDSKFPSEPDSCPTSSTRTVPRRWSDDDSIMALVHQEALLQQHDLKQMVVKCEDLEQDEAETRADNTRLAAQLQELRDQLLEKHPLVVIDKNGDEQEGVDVGSPTVAMGDKRSSQTLGTLLKIFLDVLQERNSLKMQVQELLVADLTAQTDRHAAQTLIWEQKIQAMTSQITQQGEYIEWMTEQMKSQEEGQTTDGVILPQSREGNDPPPGTRVEGCEKQLTLPSSYIICKIRTVSIGSNTSEEGADAIFPLALFDDNYIARQDTMPTSNVRAAAKDKAVMTAEDLAPEGRLLVRSDSSKSPCLTKNRSPEKSPTIIKENETQEPFFTLLDKWDEHIQGQEHAKRKENNERGEAALITKRNSAGILALPQGKKEIPLKSSKGPVRRSASQSSPSSQSSTKSLSSVIFKFPLPQPTMIRRVTTDPVMRAAAYKPLREEHLPSGPAQARQKSLNTVKLVLDESIKDVLKTTAHGGAGELATRRDLNRLLKAYSF